MAYDEYDEPLAIKKQKSVQGLFDVRDPVEVGDGGALTPPPSFGADLPALNQAGNSAPPPATPDPNLSITKTHETPPAIREAGTFSVAANSVAPIADPVTGQPNPFTTQFNALPTLEQTLANNPQGAPPPVPTAGAASPNGSVAPTTTPPPPPPVPPPAPLPTLPAQTPVSLASTAPSATQGLQAPQPSALMQSVQEALQALMQRGRQTPSIDDPTLAPQMDAFRVQQQRGAERQRGAAAERLAQGGFTSGGSGGALDSAVGQIEAQRGLNESNYAAGLVGEEVAARRQELMQGLQLAIATGQQDAAREFQRQLASVDTQLRERGLTLQEGLGAADINARNRALGLQEVLGLGGLGLQERAQSLDEYLGTTGVGQRDKALALQELFGLGDLGIRDRALTQQGLLGAGDLELRLMQSLLQDEQFYSSLGLNAAQIQALLNQDAVSRLLGAA